MVLLPICCRVVLYLQQLAGVPVHIHPKGGQRGIVDGIKRPVAVAVHLQQAGAFYYCCSEAGNLHRYHRSLSCFLDVPANIDLARMTLHAIQNWVSDFELCEH